MLTIKRQQLKEVINSSNYQLIQESVNNKTGALYGTEFDIFLCHSTSDFEEIKALKAYFLKLGKKAYVAEIDDPLLNYKKVDYTTAKRLQERMQCSKELYYVLSKNSQISTWMPWELGFFDGIKGSGKIQVLPIIDKTETEILNFKGHEYLELYTKDGTSIDHLKRLSLIERTML